MFTCNTEYYFGIPLLAEKAAILRGTLGQHLTGVAIPDELAETVDLIIEVERLRDETRECELADHAAGECPTEFADVLGALDDLVGTRRAWQRYL